MPKLTDEQIEKVLKNIPKGNPHKEKLIDMCKNVILCSLLFSVFYGISGMGFVGVVATLVAFAGIEILVETIHIVTWKIKKRKRSEKE